MTKLEQEVEELLRMNLHQQKRIHTKNDGNIFITRVMGGWIYEMEISKNGGDYERINPVFVPYSEDCYSPENDDYFASFKES